LPGFKTPADITFRKADEKNSFFIAPLLCSAVGLQKVDIVFKSKDNCRKESVVKTFFFIVERG
jgi:hypothetical protein